MENFFAYDLFISYSSKDRHKVEPIYEKLKAMGFDVFFDREALERGTDYTTAIQNALLNSRHFFVFYSDNAHKSTYVEGECAVFLNKCYNPDKRHRKMYILKEPRFSGEVPAFLDLIHRPESESDFINKFCKAMFESAREKITKLSTECQREKSKVNEARRFYMHNRFWKLVAENGDVHIFTCGRGVKLEPPVTRGHDGRTNIDVWDYRSVVDLTRFFSSQYPRTNIVIEAPSSKLQDADLTSDGLADKIQLMKSQLENKDCILIGSPDVSDYAEILLAKIHKISRYSDKHERSKKSGYVIIKEAKNTQSSFYWQKGDGEHEGVAQILGEGRIEYNECRRFEKGKPGKMFGILVVAKNPFGDPKQKRKIVILSGFSGIATNAIAKIITNQQYIEEFFKLEDQYDDLNDDFEALIGVEYEIEDNGRMGDMRTISSITFEGLVKIN